MPNKQIYATFIKADDKVIKYLGIKKYEHETMLMNFYSLHILITLTKEQNHLMSSLDNTFFNELSLFKKKLFFVFQYNTKELTPMYVLYSCESNKTGIATKKKIMKLFAEAGVNLKEVITKKKEKNNTTKFIFDY
jgi:hypothetical protein